MRGEGLGGPWGAGGGPGWEGRPWCGSGSAKKNLGGRENGWGGQGSLQEPLFLGSPCPLLEVSISFLAVPPPFWGIPDPFWGCPIPSRLLGQLPSFFWGTPTDPPCFPPSFGVPFPPQILGCPDLVGGLDELLGLGPAGQVGLLHLEQQRRHCRDRGDTPKTPREPQKHPQNSPKISPKNTL